MSRHVVASHKSRKHTPRRRVWPWVLTLVFVALAVFGGISGVFGYQFYTQARQVKEHEENALSLLKGVSDLNSLNDVDATNKQISQAQQETAKAVEIAHNNLWNAAAKIPKYGDDVSAVQGMTIVLNALMKDSLPKFMKLLSTIKNTNLSNGKGSLNVQPIIEAQKDLKTANESLQKQVEIYLALPAPHVELVRSAYESGAAQLTKLADKVNQLSKTFQILPDFLGSDQPRTYALMLMTTSEERSSGGLIGSVGVATTDNGKITVGDFRSNSDYLAYGTGDPTDDEYRIFNTWGPLHMSFDIRDLAVYPDSSRVAEGMRAIWQRTPWGANQQLDGVMLADPVFLQELVKVTGNITLSDGRVLNGDNTAEFLLNTVYKEYSDQQTDAYFQQIAEQTLGTMFTNIDFNKLMKLGETMSAMSGDRHFSMYPFDENIETTFRNAGFTAETPNSEENPKIGVYVTEQNPSKMGWYIHRTSKITRTGCDITGSQSYHVKYTLTNTLNANDWYSLPEYITGVVKDIASYGYEKVLIYAPAGGDITTVTATGTGEVSDNRKESLNGKAIYASIAKIAPGQSVTYSFDVTTSTKSISDLGIDQTPMGWLDSGVTKDVSACAIDVK